MGYQLTVQVRVGQRKERYINYPLDMRRGWRFKQEGERPTAAQHVWQSHHEQELELVRRMVDAIPSSVTGTWGYMLPWEMRPLSVWSLEIETKLLFQDDYLLLMSPKSQ